MQALNIAATGMLAQQTNVEVISNNISNMGTTGFKRHRAEFFIEPGSKLTEDPWSITKSNLPDPAVFVGAAEYIPSSLLKDVVFMLAILFATSANSLRKALCLDNPTYIEFSILKFYPL